MVRLVNSLVAIAISLAVVGCSGGSGSGAARGAVAPSPTSSATSPTLPTNPATATFTLTGTVVDQQTGNGIPSARVDVLDGVDANRSAVTDSSGAYTLTDVRAGAFNLSVSASGYATIHQRVTVDANTTVNFSLTPATRTIQGTVTDATSHSVLSDVLIQVITGPSAGQSTRTDASGHYVLSSVSSQATTLQASATGYVQSTWIVTAGGDARVDIAMTRSASQAARLQALPAPGR